jgi:hypothetical protein
MALWADQAKVRLLICAINRADAALDARVNTKIDFGII